MGSTGNINAVYTPQEFLQDFVYHCKVSCPKHIIIHLFVVLRVSVGRRWQVSHIVWKKTVFQYICPFFTSQSLVAFAKLKRQILLCQPEAKSPKDFTDSSLFWVNQEFAIM